MWFSNRRVNMRDPGWPSCQSLMPNRENMGRREKRDVVEVYAAH